MPELDPLLLSRIQFAFTISFHILFPSFTIGLAAWLVVLELLWLTTGKRSTCEIGRHWTKMFAVSFGMGVVSGVVLSYEFGTNWSVLSGRAGNILGPLITYEVLTAFFLEAGFSASCCSAAIACRRPVQCFGLHGRTGHGDLRLLDPVGQQLDADAPGLRPADGVLHVNDWWQVIFNPSFPYRFTHMVAAAYLTTAFIVGGIGAWYILRERSVPMAASWSAWP